ncbi:MAG: VTT domain-containing protein [Pseudomonadota bacterium]
MAKFAILVLVLALAVLLPFAIWGEGIEAALSQEAAQARLERWGPWAWAAGAALLVADLALPIPTTVVMAALGLIYGPLWGGLAAAFGSALAGGVGYGLGRVAGRPAAAALLGPEPLAEGEALFARAGGWLVALSRWMPVLPEVVSVCAGVARMAPGRFAAALACGCLPMGFAFAALGHAGAEAPLLTLGLSALAPAALWLAARRLLPPALGGAARAPTPRDPS